MVILGLVAAPTTMFSSTPLDCTICNEETGNCDFMKNTANFKAIPNKTWGGKNIDYNAWWVKKYCTMTAVDGFTLYFPYALLIMPLVMVFMERGFIKYVYRNIYKKLIVL